MLMGSYNSASPSFHQRATQSSLIVLRDHPLSIGLPVAELENCSSLTESNSAGFMLRKRDSNKHSVPGLLYLVH